MNKIITIPHPSENPPGMKLFGTVLLGFGVFFGYSAAFIITNYPHPLPARILMAGFIGIPSIAMGAMGYDLCTVDRNFEKFYWANKTVSSIKEEVDTQTMLDAAFKGTIRQQIFPHCADADFLKLEEAKTFLMPKKT